MTTQIQRRRGTTAQHSTFTGAEAELTVDTTKDTVVVHDGSTVGGRPLLREDQSNLPTSAPTTGIYNASGSLAISTNGTGKLFINSSGVIEGYNTQSTGAGIVTGLRLNSARATGGDGTEITFNLDFPGYSALAGIAGVFSGGGNNGHLIFKTVNSGTYAERLRITSAGLVGVGTSTVDRGGLHVANYVQQGTSTPYDNYAWLGPVYNNFGTGASNPATILVGSLNSTKDSAIIFAGGDSAGGMGSGWAIRHAKSNGAGSLAFSTHGGTGAGGETERVRIDSSGRVGIGTTSPGSALEVYATAPVLTVNSAAANASSIVLQQAGTTYARFRFDGNNVDIGNLYSNGATIFNAGNAERARIDSSGRLLVGTSTGSERLRVAGQIQIGNGTSGGGGGGFVRTTQSTATGSSHTIAFADYAPNGSGDDFSGFMVITAQFTGYPGKTAVGTFAIGKNSAAGVSVAQLSNTKIGMTTFTVGTSGNDIAVTTDASCKVSCVFMGGQ